jgi:hypothetical protein
MYPGSCTSTSSRRGAVAALLSFEGRLAAHTHAAGWSEMAASGALSGLGCYLWFGWRVSSARLTRVVVAHDLGRAAGSS